ASAAWAWSFRTMRSTPTWTREQRAVVLPLQEEDAGAERDGRRQVPADQRADGRRARVSGGSQADEALRRRKTTRRSRTLHHERSDAVPPGRTLLQSGSGSEGASESWGSPC